MTGLAVGEVPLVTGGITGYCEIPPPGREGNEGTGDIRLNMGREAWPGPAPVLCGGMGGGGVVPRGGVGGGAPPLPLGGGGGGGPMSPGWGGEYCLITGACSLGFGGRAGAPP